MDMRRVCSLLLLLICAAAEAQKIGGGTLKSVAVGGPTIGGDATFARVDITAVSKSTTAVSFVSSDPQVAPAPADVSIDIGQTYKAFVVKTAPVAVRKTVTLTARARGSADVQGNFVVIPPALSILDCEPKSLPGGSHATCKAWMNGVVAAGASPELVLSSSNRQIAYPTADTVKVPSGHQWVAFDVTMGGLPQSATASISASYDGVTKTSGLTVTPAAIQSFGCAVDTSIDPERSGRAACEIFGGDWDNYNRRHVSVGFVVHLTAKAPFGGYKMPLSFDVGAPWDIPKTLVVPAGKDAAVFPFTTTPVESPIVLKVSAKDPITHNTYMTQLTVKPPIVTEAGFEGSPYSGIPLGGRDVKVFVQFGTPPPPHGVAYDATYGGTTDIKGPARVRIDPSGGMQADFTVRVFPCAVNPPCHVSVTLGGRGATAKVYP